MPVQGRRIQARDKFTGEVIGEMPEDYPRDLREKIHRAFRAKGLVRSLPLEDRLARIRRVGEKVAAEREAFVQLMIGEAGQVQKFAAWEVDRLLRTAQEFGQLLDLIRPREIPAAGGRNLLRFEPYGVVGILTASNVPLLVPFYTLASSLGGGNAAVLKPSGASPLTARKLFDLLAPEWPDGAVQFSTCSGEAAAQEFMENPEVDVFLTYAGSAVGKDNLIKLGRYLEGTKRQVGGCMLHVGGRMKKYIPELAGNDPFLVLPGADLERAAAAAVLGGFANAGQLCIAAKRLLVHRDLFEPFTARVMAGLERLKVGDPRDPATDIGPVGKQATLNLAVYQMEDALAKGGRLLFGGRCEEPFFYPTLIALDKDVILGRSEFEKPFLWVEECFAPVRSLVVFDSEEEALALAADSAYALGASLFGDEARCLALAARLDAGRVMINEGPLYGDLYLPVGGVRDSGLYGATHKIEEVTYMKRVHIGT